MVRGGVTTLHYFITRSDHLVLVLYKIINCKVIFILLVLPNQLCFLGFFVVDNRIHLISFYNIITLLVLDIYCIYLEKRLQ